MSKTIKTLLGILSLVGILVWSTCVFVGVFFASNNSWPISLAAGVGCAMLMGFFYYLACHFSTRDAASSYGSAAATKKWIFISLYFVVAIISSWYLLHAVACYTVYKDDIQSQANEEFAALRTMVSDDENEQYSYREFTEEQVLHYSKINPYNTNEDAIFVETDDLRNLYLDTSKFNNISSEIKNFWEYATYSVEHWDIFTVASYLNELDKKKAEWDETLTECSHVVDGTDFANIGVDFDYYEPVGPTYKNLSKPLLNPSMESVTISGIITAIILQIVILLSWFSVFMSTRRGATGIKKGLEGVGVWNPNK